MTETRINPKDIFGYPSDDAPAVMQAHPDLRNPRVTRNTAVIDEVISDKGYILNPVVLTELPDGNYAVVEGFSRLTGYIEYSRQEDSTPPETVPYILVPFGNAPLYALTHNLKSKGKTPLNDLEIADYVAYLEAQGIPTDSIALALSSSKKSGMQKLNAILGIRESHPEVIKSYVDHQIDFTTAKLLSKVDKDEQLAKLSEVLAHISDGEPEAQVRKTVLGKKTNTRTATFSDTITDLVEHYLYLYVQLLMKDLDNSLWVSQLDLTTRDGRADLIENHTVRQAWKSSVEFLKISGTPSQQLRTVISHIDQDTLADAMDGVELLELVEFISKLEAYEKY